MPGPDFSYSGSIVDYTVQVAGIYDITAFGAQGGFGGGGAQGGGAGGLGAEIGGEFSLTQGEVLRLVVGGQGGYYIPGAGGGGGGSFVIEISDGGGSVYIPLLIAGGGGGGSYGSGRAGGVGRIVTTGGDGSYGGGSGGIGGAGGAGGGYNGGGGGGYSGGSSTGIPSYSGSGHGSGYSGGNGGVRGGHGGFGGGGSGGADGGGGGGGYAGGGGGGDGGSPKGGGGGGGGSFLSNAGTPLSSIAGIQSGNGLITIEPLCFLGGTQILTPLGEVPVERLVPGDLVLTHDGAVRPIAWIGSGRVVATRGRRGAATPVIVRKGAIADNVPHHDLRLTKGHALLIDGALVPVEFLVNHRSILWDDQAQEVSIYHIELETHDVLVANGAASESYRDDGNRWLFSNVNSGWNQPPKEPCLPVLTGGELVDAAWRRLLDRSGGRDLPPLTDDHDLYLVVDGRRVDATRRDGQAYSFQLPAWPSEVRIISRDAVPAELGLARDPRSLGVAVRRVVVRQGTRTSAIDAADDRLIEGFHGYEPGDDLRWTSGDALLPQALFAEVADGGELVLHLAGTMHYPLFVGARVAA